MSNFFALFIALFLLVSHKVHASDILDFNHELKLRMKIFSGLTQIEERTRILFNQTPVEKISLEKWHKIFKKEIHEYLEFLDKALPSNKTEKNIFKNIKAKIHWTSLSHFTYNQFQKIKVFTRLKGLSIVFTSLVAHVIQFTVPPLLIQMGHPFWAMLLYYSFSDIPVYTAHNMINQIAYKLKIAKLLGGKDKLAEFQEINLQVKNNLKLTSLNDFILPIDEKNALVINDVSITQKIMRRLGVSKNKVTLTRLVDFIRESNIESPELNNKLNMILESYGISKENKIALICLEFFDTADSTQIAQFKMHFGDSLIPIYNHGEFRKAQNWITHILKSQGIQDIVYWLENIPHELKPREILKMWELIILPEFAKRPDLFNYSQYRKLINNTHELKTRIHLSGKEITHLKFKKFMGEYLNHSLAKGLSTKNNCLKAHNQILLQLLNETP